jgi:hypothetical protein
LKPYLKRRSRHNSHFFGGYNLEDLSVLMKNRVYQDYEAVIEPPPVAKCKPQVSLGLLKHGFEEDVASLVEEEELDLDLSAYSDCWAPPELPDTERGPLDGIGMGAECPSEKAKEAFRHMSGEVKGNKREAQGYIWRDNKRLKTRGFKAYGSL